MDRFASQHGTPSDLLEAPPPLRRRGAAPDSLLDSRLIEQTLGRVEHLARWMGWRLRFLVVAALAGCIAVLLLARWASGTPQVPAEWVATATGQLQLARSTDPNLKPHVGKVLGSVSSPRLRTVVPDLLAITPSARWVTDNTDRVRQQAMHSQLDELLAQPRVHLTFADGSTVDVEPVPRGIASLGALFWLLTGLGLVVYMVGMIVVLASPSTRTLLYAAMCASQAGNLIFLALESTLVLGLPGPLSQLDFPLRVAFDLITGAAVVHAAALHPRRVPACTTIAWAAWVSMIAIGVPAAFGVLHEAWWWTQGAVAAAGVLTVALLVWSYRLLRHPFAIVMRRFGLMAVSTWVLLTVAVAIASADRVPSVQQQVAEVGPVIWYVFLTSLLLLMPFLSKSQQVMREFSLLAAISTVATSLDLLFVAVFSFGQFTSVTLALFLSLGLYAGAREWVLNRVRSRNMLTTERMFEKLYRIAREVEAHPDRSPSLLVQLLQELFEPLEAVVVDKRSLTVRVVSDGSTLMLPVPALTDKQVSTPASIVMRFANRGQRLFTSDDARLTDRIVEQLCRAVAFDRAVEQGRSEERLRIAQDLHDDIGARLLTLMYKAQSPEMEDYVRHTLQDLKTLTRGLAAPNHPLSHAAGEWKADLTQRLTAAQVHLGWHLTFDRDISLTVVQWSGLTRVMRELCSNAIAHAGATRVDIDFHLADDRLDLTVADNGQGRNPQAWAHGLGLGGVRKRVKQLGGEVEWREIDPQGIRCQVIIKRLSERP
jgi:signal transduction histidine kinase/nucleotide-binding universal stress UspA family protein